MPPPQSLRPGKGRTVGGITGHVRITRAREKQRIIYEDGVAIASDTAAGNFSITSSSYLGDDVHAGEYFNGSIDEVRIYGATLTAAQIVQLYNATGDGSITFTKAGQSTITCTGFTSTNSTLMNSGSCPITGKVTGQWNVVLTNPDGTSGTLTDGFTITGTNNVASGTLDSTTFDTGVAGGAQLNSVLWQGKPAGGTDVKFQFAASNSSSGPWIFIGPGGDGTTDHDPTDQNISLPLDYTLHNNNRYFRYRVTLTADPSSLYTPRVDDIFINWSP